MKEVLYISYDGMTDPLGQSQVLPYLQRLSKLGYRFTVLSFEKKDRFKKEKKIIETITSESGIKWIPLSFTAKPPVIAKIWDRYRMWQKALKLYKKNKYDLIHCRSYLAAEVGLKLKQQFGVKFLFDMRGFWADEKVDNGQWNLEYPFYKRIYRHYKAKEKEFLLHADGIVSLTQAAKNYLLADSDYAHLRIEVIPCCADLSHFDYQKLAEADIRSLKHSLGLSEQAKIITYLGSVGGWYMTEEMFRFFKIVNKQYPDYNMMILTKDDPLIVKSEIAKFDIPSEKVIVTYSDRNSLPLYLALSDYGIFFIRNSFSKKASSPTKHGELMGMGIPVICNTIGDTGNIVSTTNTGFVVDNFSEANMFEIAKKIITCPRPAKDHIRNCAKSYFNLDGGTKKYLSVYTQIFNNASVNN